MLLEKCQLETIRAETKAMVVKWKKEKDHHNIQKETGLGHQVCRDEGDQHSPQVTEEQ